MTATPTQEDHEMTDHERTGEDDDREDRGKPGSEGASGAQDSPPPTPDPDDDSPLGDTDQHSGSNA
jgi:hypothetical protein